MKVSEIEVAIFIDDIFEQWALVDIKKQGHNATKIKQNGEIITKKVNYIGQGKYKADFKSKDLE